MNPAEKAKEMFYEYCCALGHVDSMDINTFAYKNAVKRFVLMSVEEVLNNLEDHTGEDTKYWNEVKQELKKL